MGGLLRIWAIPEGTTFSVKGREVTFSSEQNILSLYCSPESMVIESPPELSENGLIYNTHISGFTPGDAAATRLLFESMNGRKFCVVYMNGQGDYLLAGSGISPLRFYAAYNSGADTADRSGWEIEFLGKTLENPISIDNPFE